MPLAHGHYPVINQAYLNAVSPSTGLFRENISMLTAGTDNAAIATGVMLSAALPLCAGDVVTNVSFRSGATAAATLTHWWFALYSNAATPALLAQSADQTSAAWAAHTTKTLALSAPVSITADGIYYVSIMVAATTVQSFVGVAKGTGITGAFFTNGAIPAQTSGSALTTTAPATIASPSSVVTVPWVAVS